MAKRRIKGVDLIYSRCLKRCEDCIYSTLRSHRIMEGGEYTSEYRRYYLCKLTNEHVVIEVQDCKTCVHFFRDFENVRHCENFEYFKTDCDYKKRSKKIKHNINKPKKKELVVVEDWELEMIDVSDQPLHEFGEWNSKTQKIEYKTRPRTTKKELMDISKKNDELYLGEIK